MDYLIHMHDSCYHEVEASFAFLNLTAVFAFITAFYLLIISLSSDIRINPGPSMFDYISP